MPWFRALVGVLAVVLAEPAAVAEKGARTRSGWVVDAHRHLFDAQGRFLYRPRFAAPLALDNGDAPLRAIRINYPAHADAARMARRRPIFEAALGDSLRVLERLPETELRIVAPSVGILEPYLAPVPRSLRRRIRVIPVEDTEDITPWARDPSLMLADGRTLLLPRDKVRAKRVEEEDAESEGELTPKARRDYFGVVEKYARAQGLRLERSLFTFEGGNVLRGRHNVFVGASLLSEAMDDLDLSEDEAREALAGELGGRLHVVGTPSRDRLGLADQPHQHIDMTMAIAADHRTGSEVALVESVSLARRLLPSTRAPRTTAEATLQRMLWPAPTDAWARHYEEGLDQVAADLAKNPTLRVLRVPGLTSPPSFRDPAFNQTNLLFSGRTAFVPHLQVGPLDEYLEQEIAHKLGYDPVRLTAPQVTLKDTAGGGDRCLMETCR